jgi:F0F1-type ATP synthase membrane subunit b/b'
VTTTLTLIAAIVLVVALVMFVWHQLEERSKRRDREIVRRIHTMLANNPRRPW